VKKRQKTAPLGAVFSTLSTALKPARLAALQWPWDLCGPERPVWSGTACVVWNGLCGLKRPVWPWDLCGPEWPVWRTCASQAKNKLEAYGLYTTSTICGSRFHGAV
jgi:hypothetical protein